MASASRRRISALALFCAFVILGHVEALSEIPSKPVEGCPVHDYEVTSEENPEVLHLLQKTGHAFRKVADILLDKADEVHDSSTQKPSGQFAQYIAQPHAGSVVQHLQAYHQGTPVSYVHPAHYPMIHYPAISSYAGVQPVITQSVSHLGNNLVSLASEYERAAQEYCGNGNVAVNMRRGQSPLSGQKSDIVVEVTLGDLRPAAANKKTPAPATEVPAHESCEDVTAAAGLSKNINTLNRSSTSEEVEVGAEKTITESSSASLEEKTAENTKGTHIIQVVEGMKLKPETNALQIETFDKTVQAVEKTIEKTVVVTSKTEETRTSIDNDEETVLTVKTYEESKPNEEALLVNENPTPAEVFANDQHSRQPYEEKVEVVEVQKDTFDNLVKSVGSASELYETLDIDEVPAEVPSHTEASTVEHVSKHNTKTVTETKEEVSIKVVDVARTTNTEQIVQQQSVPVQAAAPDMGAVEETIGCGAVADSAVPETNQKFYAYQMPTEQIVCTDQVVQQPTPPVNQDTVCEEAIENGGFIDYSPPLIAVQNGPEGGKNEQAYAYPEPCENVQQYAQPQTVPITQNVVKDVIEEATESGGITADNSVQTKYESWVPQEIEQRPWFSAVTESPEISAANCECISEGNIAIQKPTEATEYLQPASAPNQNLITEITLGANSVAQTNDIPCVQSPEVEEDIDESNMYPSSQANNYLITSNGASEGPVKEEASICETPLEEISSIHAPVLPTIAVATEAYTEECALAQDTNEKPVETTVIIQQSQKNPTDAATEIKLDANSVDHTNNDLYYPSPKEVEEEDDCTCKSYKQPSEGYENIIPSWQRYEDDDETSGKQIKTNEGFISEHKTGWDALESDMAELAKALASHVLDAEVKETSVQDADDIKDIEEYLSVPEVETHEETTTIEKENVLDKKSVVKTCEAIKEKTANGDIGKGVEDKDIVLQSGESVVNEPPVPVEKVEIAVKGSKEETYAEGLGTIQSTSSTRFYSHSYLPLYKPQTMGELQHVFMPLPFKATPTAPPMEPIVYSFSSHSTSQENQQPTSEAVYESSDMQQPVVEYVERTPQAAQMIREVEIPAYSQASQTPSPQVECLLKAAKAAEAPVYKTKQSTYVYGPSPYKASAQLAGHKYVYYSPPSEERGRDTIQQPTNQKVTYEVPDQVVYKTPEQSRGHQTVYYVPWYAENSPGKQTYKISEKTTPRWGNNAQAPIYELYGPAESKTRPKPEESVYVIRSKQTPQFSVEETPAKPAMKHRQQYSQQIPVQTVYQVEQKPSAKLTKHVQYETPRTEQHMTYAQKPLKMYSRPYAPQYSTYVSNSDNSIPIESSQNTGEYILVSAPQVQQRKPITATYSEQVRPVVTPAVTYESPRWPKPTVQEVDIQTSVPSQNSYTQNQLMGAARPRFEYANGASYYSVPQESTEEIVIQQQLPQAPIPPKRTSSYAQYNKYNKAVETSGPVTSLLTEQPDHPRRDRTNDIDEVGPNDQISVFIVGDGLVKTTPNNVYHSGGAPPPTSIPEHTQWVTSENIAPQIQWGTPEMVQQSNQWPSTSQNAEWVASESQVAADPEEAEEVTWLDSESQQGANPQEVAWVRSQTPQRSRPSLRQPLRQLKTSKLWRSHRTPESKPCPTCGATATEESAGGPDSFFHMERCEKCGARPKPANDPNCPLM